MTQTARTWSRRALTAGTVAVAALAVAGSAWAHASISPPVAKAKVLQLYTLAVPTEKEGATTTTVELIPPSGFAVDSFEPSPGWKRETKAQGSGEEATIESVTWTGGAVPTEEDSVFRFAATATSAKKLTFDVKQTYSDGSVVDWNGPESSDNPAPTVDAVSSLGGGSSSTLAIVALVLAAVALLVGLAGLATGKRPLT
jgi:uncharacterized protein YcnI